MNCESCTDRLIDLLDGAVDPTEAEAMRGHLAECEVCSGASERMRAGRELASLVRLEDPPSTVHAHVMAAARERAAGRASMRPDARESSPRTLAEETRADSLERGGASGLWPTLMRWLGGFAMGPQVAMSMLLLLMVGIGLWYLPDLRRQDPSDLHAIVDPAAGDEIGEAGGLAPAEPLALNVDPRTGRVHTREELADVEPRPTHRAEARAGGGREAPRDEPPVAVPSHHEEDDPLLGEMEAVDAAPESLLEQRGVAAPTATTGPTAEAPPTAQVPPPFADTTDESMVRRPEPDLRALLPPALHQLARNRAREAGCGDAIPSYEQLLARHPSYPGASEARLELADCYRRTGQLGRARPLLEAAAQDPRFASRAQRELMRLGVADMTSQRGAAAAPAEATPE